MKGNNCAEMFWKSSFLLQFTAFGYIFKAQCRHERVCFKILAEVQMTKFLNKIKIRYWMQMATWPVSEKEELFVFCMFKVVIFHATYGACY